MKKNIAKKWIKELRSGKYKQGTDYLKRGNDNQDFSHCCLGVLCELYNEEQKKNKRRQLPTNEVDWHGKSAIRFGQGQTSHGLSVLPKIVRDWAGIKTDCGEFINDLDNSLDDLTSLNDGGKDFNFIADIIETNVEQL